MRTRGKGLCGAVAAGLLFGLATLPGAVAAGPGGDALASGGGAALLAPIAPVTPDAPNHAPLAVRAALVGVVVPVYARLEPITPLEPDPGLAFAPLRVRVGRLSPTALPRYDALGGAAVAELALPRYDALSGAAVAGVALPAFGPLRVQAAALGPEAGPAYAPLDWQAPEHGLPVLPVYAPLGGAGAVGLDRLLTPLDLWRHGPLGMLRAEAERAAADGDFERYEALKARFFEQYRIAVQRRAVHGGRE